MVRRAGTEACSDPRRAQCGVVVGRRHDWQQCREDHRSTAR